MCVLYQNFFRLCAANFSSIRERCSLAPLRRRSRSDTSRVCHLRSRILTASQVAKSGYTKFSPLLGARQILRCPSGPKLRDPSFPHHAAKHSLARLSACRTPNYMQISNLYMHIIPLTICRKKIFRHPDLIILIDRTRATSICSAMVSGRQKSLTTHPCPCTSGIRFLSSPPPYNARAEIAPGSAPHCRSSAGGLQPIVGFRNIIACSPFPDKGVFSKIRRGRA